MKIDGHVHSKYSKRPHFWVLQKLGCQECYTEPLALYQIAKARGMSLVTITDHNTINGALDIAHLPDTFISEEITTYFPEDQCKVHVLAYNIDERQHADIQKARENIFDLINYLHAEGITHSLAHPLWAANKRLTLDHFEQMLLLFKNFELNGARETQINVFLKAVLSALTQEEIDILREKHKITPWFPEPWRKNLTGGSDDHSSLNIGLTYTQVKGARNLATFFQGLNRGRGEACGQASSPLTLARNIYSIAYQFYKQKYGLEKYANSNAFFNLLESMLQVELKPKRSLAKYFSYYYKVKNFFSFESKNGNLSSFIQKEVSNLKTIASQKNPDVQWFAIINRLANKVLHPFHEHFQKAISGANFIECLNSVTPTGIVYLGLSPYIAAFASFAEDRGLAAQIVERFLRPGEGSAREINLAHFTDTFYEINGVGLTLQRQIAAAFQAEKNYTIITCDQLTRSQQSGVQNFTPVGVFNLPEYPEQRLFHPPFLEILNFCYVNNFTHILAATPGPLGLAALAVARILELPLWGTYHTALPQYAQYLTEDPSVAGMMWKYITWFYQQMDAVFVPSRSTGAELEEKGIDPGKIRVYPRGVDLDLFHPAKRNGFLESRYQLPEGWKLLYVGRVSKEKNLQLLGRVFKALLATHPRSHLVVVGDGPYLEEMRLEMAGTPCLFTGYLEGEDLAAIYASCDLFLFPSTTDTFGNVVLEAQASGLPVIVTDAGGPQENVRHGETGLIVPGNDEASFLEAINQLLAAPRLLEEMGRAARQGMQGRSFDHAFNAAWKMYQQEAATGR
ncbi:MAG: glycosyltransferase [Thermodesulfobacteriota bacterium]